MSLTNIFKTNGGAVSIISKGQLVATPDIREKKIFGK